MTLVTEYLEARGVPFETIHHDPSPNAADEARALGVEPSEVVKALVIDVDGRHALAVIPADRRLDLRRVREALHDRHAHLTTEDELQGEFPSSELGAIPPLGKLLEAKTIVDPAVLVHPVVTFAAGDRETSIRVRTADLFPAEQVTFADIAAEEDIG